MKTYRILKFDGDDLYSYAVFYSKDVKGLRSPIFYGQALPIVCGCSRMQAQSYVDQFEKEIKRAQKPATKGNVARRIKAKGKPKPKVRKASTTRRPKPGRKPGRKSR